MLESRLRYATGPAAWCGAGDLHRGDSHGIDTTVPTALTSSSARTTSTRSSARAGEDLIYGRKGNDIIDGGDDDDFIYRRGRQRRHQGRRRQRHRLRRQQQRHDPRRERERSAPRRQRQRHRLGRLGQRQTLGRQRQRQALRRDGQRHSSKAAAGLDYLYGGDGKDTLCGRTHGNDYLAGGSARDTFVFGPGRRLRQRVDFNPVSDRLDFSAFDKTVRRLAAAAYRRGRTVVVVELGDLRPTRSSSTASRLGPILPRATLLV